MTVFERAEKPGGLLRYGIPEFKMEKAVLDRRLAQMEAEGVTFVCATSIGGSAAPGDGADGAPGPTVLEPGEERGLGTACAPDVTVRSAADVRAEFDAVVLAGGATLPRDLTVPGRELDGVHFALEYLKPSNLVREGALAASPISARGKRGHHHRGRRHRRRLPGHGAPSGCGLGAPVRDPGRAPQQRSDENPWPLWPLILRTSSAHEEGGERVFSVTTTEFVDDGSGRRARPARARGRDASSRTGARSSKRCVGHRVRAGVRAGAAGHGLRGHGAPGRRRTSSGSRSTAAAPWRRTRDWATNVDGVFVCGDQTRGQSLIVWAIAEGRSAAAAVDRWLMGDTSLPSPIVPGQLALR